MSLPTALRAYDECRDLFDRALDDPKGARACLGTYDACFAFRTRMHYFRRLDAKANRTAYPEGHPMHAVSVYDTLQVRIVPDEDKQFWLYIEPRAGGILAIEGLSEVGGLVDIEGDEVQLIEDKSNG